VLHDRSQFGTYYNNRREIILASVKEIQAQIEQLQQQAAAERKNGRGRMPTGCLEPTRKSSGSNACDFG
jgi:hypothetical protein